MTSFIIFTTQRSGSTVLTRTLDQHPEVLCAGELFHEINRIYHPEWHFPFVGITAKNKQLRNIGKIMNYPNLLFRAISHIKKFYQADSKDENARGFKLMYSQIKCMPHLWNYLKDNNIKVIVLIRKNIFKTGLSRLRMKITHLSHSEQKNQAIGNKQFYINPVKLLKHMQYIEKINRELIAKTDEMDRIIVYYEDFEQWKDLMEKICRFLKVERLSLQPALNKISGKDWKNEVSNHEEIEKFLKEKNYSQYL